MAGLDLKRKAVVPQQVIEKTKNAFDILKEVQASLQDYGVIEFPKPHSAPPSLSETAVESMSNREIEQLYSRYVGYSEFLRPKVSEALSALKISASNLKRVAANIKMQLKRDGVPTAELSAAVNDNPEYLAQECEHLKLFAIHELLHAYHTAHAHHAAALSRVVELRKLEFEQSTRGNHLSSFKHQEGKGPPRRGLSRG